MPEIGENILEIKNLTKSFFLKDNTILTACDNVTLSVPKGQTLGIAGESGCGKSTLLKAIMNIDPATEGKILLNGKDITKLKGEELRQNYRRIQLVFQDAALDPKMKIKDIVTESLINFKLIKKSEVGEKARELLRQAELSEDFLERYPESLSGGERQRAAIARALALEPEIILFDEATSALDVSVQDAVIKLLAKLQKEKGLTYIFVSHDLALLSLFAHKIAVMYKGKIVEEIEGDKLQEAKHPYTKVLLNSVL